MRKKSNAVVNAVRSQRHPEDTSNLPVLTDVLVMSEDAQGRILWLAWDDRRVPVLTQAVEPVEEATLPRWARKRI
jgi:hypothetical protein